MYTTMEDVSTCTRCKTSFDVFDGARTGIRKAQDEGYTEVICPACIFSERIHSYKTTGEMSSRLVGDALVARLYLSGECSPHRLRATSWAMWQANKDALLEIAANNDQIAARAREWEEKQWMGTLQALYRVGNSRGYSAEGDGYKAMMWGSAGRVLVTLQDLHHQGHPQSKYGGAWITIIFDEDSPTPRGGVQGYCATLAEALALLNDSYNNLPQMVANSEVTIGV